MKKVMLTTLVLSLVMLGCSKEEEIELAAPILNNDTPSINHMPLAIGNYWVYETYIIDTLGNETLNSPNDSAYVDRDTLINGNTYYIIEGDFFATFAIGSILRNENNSVLYYNTYDNTDNIIFTTNNIGDIYLSRLDTNIFSASTWVNPSKINKNVAAGSFLSYDRETEITPLIPNHPIGIRSSHTYYNKDVGVVANQLFYMSSHDIIESRLVRFHLN